MITSGAVLVALLVSAPALAHKFPEYSRKSLSFGPVHPHRIFNVEPPQLVPSLTAAVAEPRDIALRFINEAVLPQDEQRRHSFVLREDSYTDASSGVSHFYARQLVNGLEVADGNININIFQGKVISYGDSFFKGTAPPVGVDSVHEDAPSQSTYCDQLQQALTEHVLFTTANQVIIDNDKTHKKLAKLYSHNCETRIPASLHADTAIVEPARAALSFMIAAHPDSSVSQEIVENFDALLAGITSHVESHFVGTDSQSSPYSSQSEYLHNVPGTVGPVRARLAYVQTPQHDCHTQLALVWKLEVEMENNWYEAAVSVSDATRIFEVVDWASDASDEPAGSYNVWKWGINDPESGERSMEYSPADSVASPWGWHSLPDSKDPKSKGNNTGKDFISNYTSTWGNNVFAHENWAGRSAWMDNYRPDGGKKLMFNYTYELKTKNGTWAEPNSYIDLTITQLFYTSNMVHDLYYRYGFDELAGNFQQYNFGKGGKDDDAVIANAQDGSGYNNANFMTPPDGQNGRMRMYTWNVHGYPYRDGDLEAGIVIHELSHGLSTRLTGGPADSGCLGWGESGGMGEGWGDFLATTIRSVELYSDYSMGSWAANETNGIRNYVYSTNMTINPSTYHTLDKSGYWGVHAIGEVWAEILWVVSNRLIEKYGWSATLFPPIPLEDGTLPENNFYRKVEYTEDGTPKRLIPKHGNSLVVQLVLDAMKLQPCRPGFFEARDAIIQADQILTGGENTCLLWLAFAERGLGHDATVTGRTPWGGGIRKDGFGVAKKCRDESPEPKPEPAPKDPKDGDKDKKHKHKD